MRFRFEPDALEVVIGKEEASSENSFVGGENRWKYDTFTNWEFWWPGFPILVYFKVQSEFSCNQLGALVAWFPNPRLFQGTV